MHETPNHGLTLLAASQAQKHVTVNEALFRLDALSGAVMSRSLAEPPADAVDGSLYIVPSDAAGEWVGRGGSLAFLANGGWSFVTPRPGRQAWIADEGRNALFDGTDWMVVDGALIGGACAALAVATLDHAVTPGTESLTAPIIPDKAMVFGVTGRVLAPLGAGAWRLGVAGAVDRYGSGYGMEAGSTVLGVTGGPLAYYGDTALRLEADGEPFFGGVVRLCVHYLTLTPPR